METITHKSCRPTMASLPMNLCIRRAACGTRMEVIVSFPWTTISHTQLIGTQGYANAVTNPSATSDPYPYYLPLGVPLPGGARPTCNTCLQNELAIFSSFAGNSTQPISKTYNQAAQQIQISCGTGFVNQTAVPLKGAASATTASLTPTITLFVMLFIYLFQ